MKRSSKRVLLVTADEPNEGVDAVVRAIRNDGGRCISVDPMQFPASWPLAMAAGHATSASYLGTLKLSEISAVWFRCEHAGFRLPKSLDPEVRAVCVDAATTVLEGTLAPLRAFLLDSPRHARAAFNKVHQLAIAESFGLEIPRTVVTNDPKAVRRFAKSCKRGLIAKMPVSTQVVIGDSAVYTNRIEPNDLEGLDLCPMIFQERVEKALELRVTVVGNEVFAASVDSGSAVDWRRDQAPIMHTWKPYRLPKRLEKKLLRLLDELRLNYGGVDFILTPDDRTVFLEVNPLGEFSWIEHHTRMPISTAIAELLLGRTKPRVAPD